MLQNEALVAKIGFDTAENELSKVCRYQPSTPPTVISSALGTHRPQIVDPRLDCPRWAPAHHGQATVCQGLLRRRTGIGPMLAPTQLSNYLALEGSFSSVSTASITRKDAI